MQITKLYIVTKPTQHSTISDILMEEISFTGLQHQFGGGLLADEIIGAFTTKEEAVALAKKAMTSFSEYRDFLKSCQS